METRKAKKRAPRLECLEDRVALNASWNSTYSASGEPRGLAKAMANQVENLMKRIDQQGTTDVNVGGIWSVGKNYVSHDETYSG